MSIKAHLFALKHSFAVALFSCLTICQAVVGPANAYGAGRCEEALNKSPLAEFVGSLASLDKTLRITKVDEDSGIIELEVIPGRPQPFEDPGPLLRVMQKFPQLAKDLGIEIISAEPNFIKFRVPTPDALNKRLETLRAEGALPKNGFNLAYVPGKISDYDYLKMVESGLVPLGTDRLFFHDYFLHILPFLYMPESFAKTIQQDIHLMTVVLPKAFAKHRAHADDHYKALSIHVDGGTTITTFISSMNKYQQFLKLRQRYLGMLLKEYRMFTDEKSRDMIQALIEKYKELENVNFDHLPRALD